MRESIEIEKHNTIDKKQEGKPLELHFLKQVKASYFKASYFNRIVRM
jgi:hypothetical protein